MSDSFQPPSIVLQTCEGPSGGRRLPWTVDTDTFELTEINDTFGLRQAVLPVFEAASDGHLTGCGTAFSIDPWGRVVTAHHVVEHGFGGTGQRNMTALLSFGVVFGEVKVPDNAFARFDRALSLTLAANDPLRSLQGVDESIHLDLALIELGPTHDRSLIANLPIRLAGRTIAKGDHVVAVGFPGIETIRDNSSRAYSQVSEGGMQCSRGIVVDLLPEGHGKSRPTPSIEIECNWPPGMSGGPVFNVHGEVIGIVSRSIEAEVGKRAGTGWATWLAATPHIGKLLRSVDPYNPMWRRCWGGFGVDGKLLGVCDHASSPQHRAAYNEALEWRPISWQPGTDNHMPT